MTREEVHDLMENELRCVQRGKYCDRDCAKCPLVKEDKELIEAYGYVIKALEQEPTDKNFTKADIDAIAKALNEGWELRANEVLDKLRAEIAELWHQYPMGHNYELAINRCLKVIDKYKAESEVEDGECK